MFRPGGISFAEIPGMRTIARTHTGGALGARSHAITLVVTPGSGNGRALQKARQLREALRARGHQVKIETFSDLEGLRRWATSGDSRFSLLISVGGDGTQDTAALAALRRSVPFVSVPSGFGNLFARALGHSDRVDHVIDTLEHGRLVYIDVGIRNGEPFLCQKSYGLLAQIENEVGIAGRPRARWRRGLAYYQMALRYLRTMPLTTFRVAVDGRVVSRDAAIVTVANVETYGSWLNLTPTASPIDGLLDVFVMERATKRAIVAKLLKRQLHIPGTEEGTFLRRGRHISVRASHQAADEISLIRHRLPVLVSSTTAEALEHGLATTDDVSQVA
jgi:diacylglycerol kinase (ATP)